MSPTPRVDLLATPWRDVNASSVFEEMVLKERAFSLVDGTRGSHACGHHNASESEHPRGAWPEAAQQGGPRVPCTVDGVRGSAVRILVGILSAPNARASREVIRQTWLADAARPIDTLGCFIVGNASTVEEERTLAAEKSEFGDIISVDATEGRITAEKAFSFWVMASEWSVAAPRIKYVARIDDDTLIVLPRLRDILRDYRCRRHVCIGSMIHSAISPNECHQCSWSWDRGTSLRLYRQRDCAASGFHPPFPFPMGRLQVLSTATLHALAAPARLPAARSFFSALRTRCWSHPGGERGHEDATFGYWLATAQREETAAAANPANASTLHVDYVDIGTGSVAHDFGCYNHPAGRSMGTGTSHIAPTHCPHSPYFYA